MLTKENHLGALYQLAPQLLAYKYGKTLDTFLSQFPTKEFDDDSEYTWDVIGSSRRNIPLLEARKEDGTPVGTNGDELIGANTAPFYLVFAEDWYMRAV